MINTFSTSGERFSQKLIAYCLIKIQGIVEVLYSTHCFCDSASKSLQLHLKKKNHSHEWLSDFPVIDLEQNRLIWFGKFKNKVTVNEFNSLPFKIKRKYSMLTNVTFYGLLWKISTEETSCCSFLKAKCHFSLPHIQ